MWQFQPKPGHLQSPSGLSVIYEIASSACPNLAQGHGGCRAVELEPRLSRAQASVHVLDVLYPLVLLSGRNLLILAQRWEGVSRSGWCRQPDEPRVGWNSRRCWQPSCPAISPRADISVRASKPFWSHEAKKSEMYFISGFRAKVIEQCSD